MKQPLTCSPAILSEGFSPSRTSPTLLTILLFLSLTTLTACSGEKPATLIPPETVAGITLFTAQRTTVPDYTEATGTVRAAQSAQLSSQVMGAITRLNVREGDQVRRGEVLITIDAAQQRSAYDSANAGLSASQQSIAAADADYALAEATMNRYQMLFDKKSVSPQEYDEVKTRLAAAKARRDAARAGQTQAEAGVAEASTAIGFTKIRAPFDGLVVAKLADAGAMAAPGVPLLTIEDPSRFRLEALLDEGQIGTVRLGEAVPVVLDSLGRSDDCGEGSADYAYGRSGEPDIHGEDRSAGESANSIGSVRPRTLPARRTRINPCSTKRTGASRTVGRRVRGGQRPDRQSALHHTGQTFR